MILDIATAIKRTQKRWQNKKMSWDELVDRFAETQRTNETYKEYLAASKKIQDDIKDVGGFVGGYLDGGRRSNVTIRHRQVITLDIDDCPVSMDEGLVDLLLKAAPYELAIYSTHKHTPEKPRLRLVIPLDRPVSPEEYEAVSRFIAGKANIEFFDPTTFQPARFMYWPSTSSDGEYFFTHEWGKFCSPDAILSQYVDWKDISSWPRLSTEEPEINKESEKRGDPREISGVVGAFCRAYSVEEAIDAFLENVYAPTNPGSFDRYTYLDGTSSGGGVVYNDGLFFYSNHSSDPAGGELNNSFDLVRIHKFGGLDADRTVSILKRPSFKSMCEFALKDKNVVAELDNVDRPLDKALLLEFKDEVDEWSDTDIDDIDAFLSGEGAIVNPDNVPDMYIPEFKSELPGGINGENWKDSLERTKKGDIEAKISNLKLIILFDPDLRGKIMLDDLEKVICVKGALPWNKNTEYRRWEDTDEAGLMELIETRYELNNPSKTFYALVLASTYNRFHPVKSFLDNLEWDGIPRLDTLFIDYLGADDTPYTRAVTRKSFTAAVTRIYKPGSKMDYVPVLVGAEGLKKSSLLAEMGGRWFSDSFTTVDGTKAFEQIQGCWVIEIAELSAFNRSETNSIKAFVTRRVDRFRGAYQRNTQVCPRQCVFFATTNDLNFLKGNTGNRRFWPVMVHKRYEPVAVVEKTSNGSEPILGLPVHQLWAEAKHYYEKGEKLYLEPKLEKVAKDKQEEFSEVDERLGLIEEYLEIPLPADWDNFSRMERKEYLNTPSEHRGEPRDTFCILEIWEECLGLAMKDLNNFKAKELHGLLRRLHNWEYRDSRKAIPPYGTQRYFSRKKERVFGKWGK